MIKVFHIYHVRLSIFKLRLDTAATVSLQDTPRQPAAGKLLAAETGPFVIITKPDVTSYLRPTRRHTLARNHID